MKQTGSPQFHAPRFAAAFCTISARLRCVALKPREFELIIDSTTAKALGLAIPEAFLMRADDVIE